MTTKFLCLTLCLLLISSSFCQQFTTETRARFEQIIRDRMAHPVAMHEAEPVNQISSNFIGNHEEVYAFKDSKANMLQFTLGFLEGVGTAPLFDQIKVCISDVDLATANIILAINDIKSKQIDKVKEGIEILGKVAQIVPTAVKDCKASSADFETIIKKIESFKNPMSFFYFVGKSLMINRVEVFHEVQSAVSAYEKQDYKELGFYVGKAMDTIFIAHSTQVTEVQGTTEVLSFAKGFLEGVGTATAFDNIRLCIADSESIFKDIKTGITLIATKNPAKVKEGIAILGEAAQFIPTAAKICQVAEVNIQSLLRMIQAFKSPESFLYYVGKSLLLNRVEIFHEIKGAVDAYQQHDFYQVGYFVGKAMDTIILGQHQSLNQGFVEHLNEVSGWKAAMPAKFEGMTYEEIKNQFLGANLIDLSTISNLTEFNYEGFANDIPANFNSAEQWPGCVHPIRDQQHCGSCWAFAASEVLSDRFCIASDKKIDVVLSPQYLLSCNNVLNHGCNGGVPLFSWWFITSDGLVTDDCLPYQSGSGTNPVSCKSFTQCADGKPIQKYYGTKGSTVALKNPASIQANILQYGPVEAGFQVFQDFMYYKGGIYKHTSGSLLGGHAVKIVGWGNEDGTNYWIVANSWGTSWGEDGFFRIAFGQCGIDTGVVAGQADVKRSQQTENVWWMN